MTFLQGALLTSLLINVWLMVALNMLHNTNERNAKRLLRRMGVNSFAAGHNSGKIHN